MVKFTELLSPPWNKAHRFVKMCPEVSSTRALGLISEMLADREGWSNPKVWNPETYWDLFWLALAREVLRRCGEVGINKAFREHTCAVFPKVLRRVGEAHWLALDICNGKVAVDSSPFPAPVTKGEIKVDDFQADEVRKAHDDLIRRLESSGWKRVVQFYPEHYWCAIYRRTL